MKKLVLLIAVILSLWSCKSERDPFNEQRIANIGDYDVDLYVINGDTLYSSLGINKIQADNITVSVLRNKADSVTVITKIQYSSGIPSQFIYQDYYGFKKTSKGSTWLSQDSDAGKYEGKIENNTFYQWQSFLTSESRFFIYPVTYVLKEATDPSLRGVLIRAK